MNPFVIITAAGPDRPGIVSRMTRVLFETGCNIEDTSMTLLRGEFAMILIVRLPRGFSPEELERRFLPVVKTLGLSFLVKPLSRKESRRTASLQGRPFILSVYGSDHPGIVYRVTQLLARRKINITDMNTRVVGPKTRPIYVMVLELQIPDGVRTKTLNKEFEALKKTLKVDITLNPMETAQL